jgi:hypothetical protein
VLHYGIVVCIIAECCGFVWIALDFTALCCIELFEFYVPYCFCFMGCAAILGKMGRETSVKMGRETSVKMGRETSVKII